MEVDECSAGGDSGAEEDEDDGSSHGSRSNSSSSSISGSSTSTDSGDDSGEEHATSGSESHSSGEEDEEENENTEYSVKAESPDTLKWETCVAANIKVKLPQDLCEHAAIFKEFLDYPYIWNECLTESQRETLCNLLPVFPKDCDVEAEIEKTLRMLFEHENQRFGLAPLDVFHTHLSAGHYRPDIRRMCSLVRKAQQRRLLFEERKRSYELASQLLKSRESLLSNAYKQGFCQPALRTMSKVQWRKPKPAMVEEKTQLRYLEELNALRTELGVSAKLAADTTSENEENYPYHQMSGTKQKKKRRSVMGIQGLSIRGMQINHEDETIRPVFSTLQRAEYPTNRSFFIREHTEEMYREMLLEHKKRRARRDIHPELNTQGIALADLTQRAQIGQKHKLSIGPAMRITPAKKRIKLEQSPLCPPAPRLMNSNSIKHESDNSDYSHTTDENKHSSTLDMDHRMLTPIKSEPIDAYEMHQMSKKKLSPVTPKGNKSSVMTTPEIKKEVEDMDYEDIKTEFSTGMNEDAPLETEEDEENDKKELDLDSIDMMQLPIQLDDGIDILDDVKCEDEGVISMPDKELTTASANEGAIDINSGAELMQETHACFFSLLRDAFTSKGEYRMSGGEMRDAVTQWQGNPISPLNDWYSMAASWPALVPLALGFLAGELTYSQDMGDRQERDLELVPYLENKGNGVYAWIGAGRDSDSRLSDLCAKFLMCKESLGPPSTTTTTSAVVAIKQQTQVIQSGSNVNTNSNSGNVNTSASGRDSSSPAIESISVDGGSINTVTEWEPPRALWPTEWKVRPSTTEEREEFRRQERMRYAAPHKAFTYRMHGYASVVGPVKGIYQHNVASGLTKARGHSLLVADRPNFVTILALVRDATARLPNGEGTRADICQLLKDSQYIRDQTESDDKEGYLHSVVSGALDRLHYETDPCVRYYPRRKEWLYLHRARSESEFEMYHQQLQGVAKNKKNVGSMSRNKTLPPVIKPTNISKEQSPSNVKETTPKKERKTTSTAQPIISRKEQKKTEEKINDHSVSTEQSAVVTSTTTTISTPSTSVISVTGTTVPVTSFPTSTSISTVTAEKDVITNSEVKPTITTVAPAKKTANIAGKPVAVVKTSAQSLLQSNQHFPHHQIQVSTSAGLQTIRLSGHSVLHSAQSVVASSANPTNVTTNLTTILPPAKVQSQQQQLQQPQQQQQQTIVTNQPGKSILQTANIKQQQSQQQQHVLPGKTLLASQIKLVSSGQIKSLLTGHGLQGQTIFIKQSSPSSNQSQQIQQQQLKQQQQQQIQQRVVANQQQSIQTSGMQRIIAQIGGKPIAVQIQQSPHQQQQQQQKILAKVLTSSGGGQLISVESLLAQKGLKLATTTSHPNQLNRQGKQVIQTQYQVVSQAQTSSGQSKIIASTQQQQQQQAQTVRMVTAQLAGKPIVLASGNKNVGVGVSSGGSVVLGKQQTSQQQTQQQPIILPSQLLNIKTLHGLKVIPTPAGLKTTGAAVYARVIAPTTITSSQSTGNQQQTIQTQPSRNNTYSTP
ncbi:nuclear factor related to kappaB binding protein isoform X2 [Xylocopa sonorina]|uniref:nuclear factor related to kappaB binding protein isoform X1 n=1 Tax=Xylocopa sonorina TaxID=1818115 RepID=UPI00403AA340